MIKTPKIYFIDTGLACNLLGIDSEEQLKKDPLYGNLYENFIVMELMKSRYNQALDPKLYFYRDATGWEVDLLFQQGSALIPLEIKSSKTFSPAFLEGLEYFHKQTNRARNGAIIYGGSHSQKIGNYQVFTPENCTEFFTSG